MDFIIDKSGIITIAALILLVLFREGVQQRYMYINQTKRLSTIWHALGFWLRFVLIGLTYVVTVDLWFTGVALILLSVGYNVTINLFKGHRWYYVGTIAWTDRMIRKVLWFVKFE